MLTSRKKVDNVQKTHENGPMSDFPPRKFQQLAVLCPECRRYIRAADVRGYYVPAYHKGRLVVLHKLPGCRDHKNLR